MAKKEDDDMPIRAAIRALSSAYGPLAFGVVALLTIWLGIVGPELESNRSNEASRLEASQNYREAAFALDRVSERAARQVEKLAETAERLERMETRRDTRN